ncbi:MAG: type II toxin-antitoxin system VapC family toxin [Betaproteobacteria bacterium]
MEPLELSSLPDGALVLVDSAPVIYLLQKHPVWASRFLPVADRHAAGTLLLAVSTITIAEVLTGPLGAGEEALARRYRATMESWQVIDLSAQIAEDAARLRASLRLRLPDAVQVATAMAVNADALVTHDRDFSRVRGLRILS